MVWDHEVVGSNPTAPILHQRTIARVEAEVLMLVVGAPFSSLKKHRNGILAKSTKSQIPDFAGQIPPPRYTLNPNIEIRNPKQI
jgi:hypothetical protein